MKLSFKKVRILLTFVHDDLEEALAFVKQEFELGSGSNSIKAKLESVWRQTGHKPKELEELKVMPEVFSALWEDFINLNNTRTSNGFGANAISYTELQAYYSLNQIPVQPWEIQVLRYFDNVVLNVYARQIEKEHKKNK